MNRLFGHILPLKYIKVGMFPCHVSTPEDKFGRLFFVFALFNFEPLIGG
jgi:hypothetical protein